MSLLGLLKQAHDIYKKMEVSRWFGSTRIRSQKAPGILELYTKHFKLQAEGNPSPNELVEHENTLARAILTFLPEPPPAPPVAVPATEAAKEPQIAPPKNKIRIIFDILQICAKAQLQDELKAETAFTLPENARSLFTTHFSQDDETKLFLHEVTNFLQFQEKPRETRLELKKTKEDLKLEKSQRSKHETASNTTINKLLTELKQKESNVDQLTDLLDQKDEFSIPRSGSSYSYVHAAAKGLNTAFSKNAASTHAGHNLSAQNHPPAAVRDSVFSFVRKL